MKFTEEQFKEIIRTYENNYGSDNKILSIIRVVNNFNGSLSYNEAFALANPVTREWAHEQFVEEEKKYVWTSERKTGDVFMRLYKSKRGYIGSALVIENGETGLYEKLTESEIREWGYNPDMFNKEEVK